MRYLVNDRGLSHVVASLALTTDQFKYELSIDHAN